MPFGDILDTASKKVERIFIVKVIIPQSDVMRISDFLADRARAYVTKVLKFTKFLNAQYKID